MNLLRDHTKMHLIFFSLLIFFFFFMTDIFLSQVQYFRHNVVHLTNMD